MTKILTRCTAAAPLVLLLALLLGAGDATKPINWTAPDRSGKPVTVPAGDQVTVLLFVRARQPQSQQAIEAVGKASEARPDTPVVVVVSGQDAVADAKKVYEDLAFDWPVVPDADYAISGGASVRVWPTAVIVKPGGEQAAHLAGYPKTFAADFPAHLDQAMGKITQEQLKQRLEDRSIVMDTPQHVAQRHAMVAQRLLEKGDLQMAQAELESGLKLAPDDATLKLSMANLLIRLEKPAEAVAMIETIRANGVPGWQLGVVRARALIAQKQWPQAKAVLLDAIKLNPNPAEAHYLLGLIHEQESDLPAAAAEFKKAYEALAKQK